MNILTISEIYENNNYVYSSCIIFDKNNFTIFCTGYQNYIKIYNQAGEFMRTFEKVEGKRELREVEGS